MKKKKNFRTDTQLSRLGRTPQEHWGFVNTPVYRGSTVLFKNLDDFLNHRSRYEYGRISNPNSASLHEAWAALAGAAGAVSAPSGVAAIMLALLSAVKPGDHLLVADTVYFPTRKLCDGFLKKFGIEIAYYDPLIGAGISKLFKKNTVAVYAESPGSLTFEVQDVPALAKAAHAHGAVLLLDNTWATPLFFPAHKHGVDICIEAGTKYLVGHADANIGLVSATKEYFPKIQEMHLLFGMAAAPDELFLALRGLRTLSVRLRHQEKSALTIARWLSKRKEIARVLHPALPSCSGHKLWKRDFSGSGSVFAVELKPVKNKAIAAFVDGLDLFGLGASWGGFESLIVPVSCSYRTLPQPKAPLLRLQIGLEDERDLINDLEAGLERLAKA